VNIAKIFFSFQSIVIVCVLYGVTEALRRLVQASWKDWRRSKLYNDFGLWVAPMTNGALFAHFTRSFPWPEGLNDAWSRSTYCVVLGIFCGSVYGRIKRWVETGEPPK
jgi:hypothetical protein